MELNRLKVGHLCDFNRPDDGGLSGHWRIIPHCPPDALKLNAPVAGSIAGLKRAYFREHVLRRTAVCRC
jgi:hypothetical protein